MATPGGRVSYAGDTRIDGVAGTAAPIRLNFLDAWGSVTGSVFPTGSRVDVIDGVDATCIDAAMPLMIVRADDLGVDGRAAPEQLDADADLIGRLESMRRKAGLLMGLGDVTDRVIPKPVLVSAGEDERSITSRYFTPHRCHTSHAATGAIGVAAAFALPGTVANSTVAGAPSRRRRSRHHRPAPAGPHRRTGRARPRRRPARGHPSIPGSHRSQDHAGRAAPAGLRVLHPGRRGARVRPAVPQPAHHDHRPHLRRRRQRHHRPRDRPPARSRSRSDRHRRQPLRRPRLGRRRVRRPGPTRRAHAAAGLHRHPRHEPGPAARRLRPGRRLRADRTDRLVTERAGHRGQRAAHHRARPHRAAQGRSEPLPLCIGGRRHRTASRGRTVRAERERASCAR